MSDLPTQQALLVIRKVQEEMYSLAKAATTLPLTEFIECLDSALSGADKMEPELYKQFAGQLGEIRHLAVLLQNFRDEYLRQRLHL